MSEQPHRQRHRSRQVPLDDLPERFTLPILDASEKLAFYLQGIAGAEHQRCA